MSKRAPIAAVLLAASISMHAADAKPLLGCAKNVTIASAVTRTRLPLARRNANAAIELVLRDIHFERHPGAQFHVILERRDDPTKRARAGTLSFFVATNAAVTTTRTFDVTDELQELGAMKDVNVVLEATSGRAGAKPRLAADAKLTIGTIELRVK